MKKAALVLGLLATPGVWAADFLLLGVPAFRNGWATLPLFLVPFLLLVLGWGAEKAGKLAAAAWIVFVLGAGGYPALRLLTGNIGDKLELQAGTRAPNFTLKDQEGKDVSLSDFTDDHRVLLVFFRGHGCPYCAAELRGLAARYDDFKASRVEVVAISPQLPEKNKAMGLPFPVLSDPELKVTADYGLVHAKAMFGQDMPRPTTILVHNGDRNIQWLKAADNVRIRPTPDEIIDALRR